MLPAASLQVSATAIILPRDLATSHWHSFLREIKQVPNNHLEMIFGETFYILCTETKSEQIAPGVQGCHSVPTRVPLAFNPQHNCSQHQKLRHGSQGYSDPQSDQPDLGQLFFLAELIGTCLK